MIEEMTAASVLELLNCNEWQRESFIASIQISIASGTLTLPDLKQKLANISLLINQLKEIPGYNE